MEKNKSNQKSKAYRIIRNLVIGVLCFLVLATAFVYWYDNAGQQPDTKFDVSIKKPTFVSEHPRILFDVAHNNFHTPTGRYEPLAKLLRNDGYTITENNKPFITSTLDSFQVLLIANAMGPHGHDGWDAFTIQEDSAIVNWVRKGGSLLLVADHVPFGSAALKLSQSFGVEMNLRFARDDKNHEGWDNEKLLFSPENGLLTDCPITKGRDASEKVCNVITFTGQSLTVPNGAKAILKMGDNSYDWESRKIRFPAKGHAQCVALNFGKGRVVILGEAAVLSAQVDPLGSKRGMNYSGSCDKQFALNILHWLSNKLN